jgi:hypothetical protein
MPGERRALINPNAAAHPETIEQKSYVSMTTLQIARPVAEVLRDLRFSTAGFPSWSLVHRQPGRPLQAEHGSGGVSTGANHAG